MKLLPVRHARKGLGRGYFLCQLFPVRSSNQLLNAPSPSLTVRISSGQRKRHSVITIPNYDVKKLSESVCQSRGWNLAHVRFYKGVPDKTDDARWNHFWIGKLAVG